MTASPASTDLIDLHGVQVQLVRAGGKGPRMLLLHGAGGSVAQAPFFARLAERFDIYAPTHPGFAGSPMPDHFDAADDLAYLYLDLLDKYDLRDAVVLGFSFGGWIAAEVATKSTARIGKLVLVDAVGIRISGPTVRDIADIYAMAPMDANRLLYHDPSKVPDLSGLPDEAFTALAKNREALTVYGWEPYLHNPKLTRRLHRVNVPTLVLWGANDRLVSADYGRKYAELIPGARFTAIPDCGHLPQAEQPEAFLRHVVDFAA
ncbi:MAG: alpha/beta fold hydrolase [Rhodospirillales bacterium]